MDERVEEALLVKTDRCCRYCGEKLRVRTSVCRVCGKYQNRVKEWLSLLASLAIIVSAVISLGLLGLSYIQSRQASATLQLANTAKAQAEETSGRIHAVEGVLTMVDLASGGRKLCLAYRDLTWAQLEAGVTKDTPLYVPASWTPNACKSQARNLGATRFRLGCVFADHASIGPFTATTGASVVIPAENCGW